MPTKVNLDALIPREDFETQTGETGAKKKSELSVSDLRREDFFYTSLRKPDFQRETAEWDAKRIVGLVRTFVEEGLIPGVILWQNRDLFFVIDGSHRLSALIAWVNDDYGDGVVSKEFFGDAIPDEQRRVADLTRQMIKAEIGSYEDHLRAAQRSDQFAPDLVARARRLGGIPLAAQWVTGTSKIAEASFIRINQQAAIITPQELDLIQSRKKPRAIAARAIFRRGTGHKYWSNFDAPIRQEVESTATRLHSALFEPSPRATISLDLAPGGPVYSGTALGMVYEFVKLCAMPETPGEDATGERTLTYLKRCEKVMRTILSNHISSLGLHPAVYFYSWTGKQQPILFLAATHMVIDLERQNKFKWFTKHRARFEDFLVANRSLVSQVIRKFGAKKSGLSHIRDLYEEILNAIAAGREFEEIVAELQATRNYLQPAEDLFEGTPGKKISSSVRSGVALKQLMGTALRCALCGGYVPGQAISADHILSRSAGGTSREALHRWPELRLSTIVEKFSAQEAENRPSRALFVCSRRRFAAPGHTTPQRGADLAAPGTGSRARMPRTHVRCSSPARGSGPSRSPRAV